MSQETFSPRQTSMVCLPEGPLLFHPVDGKCPTSKHWFSLNWSRTLQESHWESWGHMTSYLHQLMKPSPYRGYLPGTLILFFLLHWPPLAPALFSLCPGFWSSLQTSHGGVPSVPAPHRSAQEKPMRTHSLGLQLLPKTRWSQGPTEGPGHQG